MPRFTVFVLVAAACGLPLIVAAPAAADPRCDAPEAIKGTSAGETINGTAGDDVICGLGGDDTINGLGGDDVLVGGLGADRLVGGPGRDLASYVSRTAAITVSLNGLADDGALGEDDYVETEDVTSGSGDDIVNGSPLNNRIDTGTGDDTVRARAGNDEVLGGAGDDRLDGGQGIDEVRCGSDTDVAGADPQDVFEDCESEADARGAVAPGQSVATTDTLTCVILADEQVGCAGDPNKVNARFTRDIFGGTPTAWPAVGGDVPPYLHRIDLGPGRVPVAITASRDTACVILDDGRVLCWGRSPSPGFAYKPADVTPRTLPNGRSAVRFVTDRCALANDGTLHCFSGGGPQTGSQMIPVPGAATDVVGTHYSRLCGIFSGDVRCWSWGTNTLDPAIELGVGRSAVKLTAGEAHTCALMDDASVRCFGDPTQGRLGRPTGSPTSLPIDLGAGRTAVDISAHRRHTCAVLDDGAVRCWGLGWYGATGQGNQLIVGDNETPGEVGPVDLGGGRSAVRLAAGQTADHTCVTLTDGKLQCWGANFYRQLVTSDRMTIGDNEKPSAVGPIDLGGDL